MCFVPQGCSIYNRTLPGIRSKIATKISSKIPRGLRYEIPPGIMRLEDFILLQEALYSKGLFRIPLEGIYFEISKDVPSGLSSEVLSSSPTVTLRYSFGDCFHDLSSNFHRVSF